MQYQEEGPWADGVGELRIPLRPGEGEPTSAGRLEVTVTLEDGTGQPGDVAEFLGESDERGSGF